MTTDRDPRGEFDLIERFRRLLPQPGDDLVIGPGDDCAGIALGDELLLLLTCDALVEGRHFWTRHLGPRDLGRNQGGQAVFEACEASSGEERCRSVDAEPREVDERGADRGGAPAGWDDCWDT